MLYEKLMNLPPQQVAGFVVYPPLLLVPTKKTGFLPEKPKVKPCGTIDWTDGKTTLTWDGSHRYQYPTGRKVYKNGRVFLDMDALNIDGQIMGCAAKGNITVVFLWTGSINVRFFQGKQPFIHITIASNLTNFMPLQLAAINKSVTKAALLFSDDFTNRLILIDLDTANSDPNLWAVKTSESNQVLEGATIPNGFRSAPILAAVDFKEDERIDFLMVTEFTDQVTNTTNVNESAAQKWSYGNRYNFCWWHGDYYRDSNPNFALFDAIADLRGTGYEGVTNKSNYLDVTYTNARTTNMSVTRNMETQHFRNYNGSFQTRTISYTAQAYYGFVECGRDQPPQNHYNSSFPQYSGGSSNSTNSESSNETAYLTFTTDLDLRYDLIATLKFTKGSAMVYTIKINGEIKHQESKALPVDFSSYYSWFLKLYTYSIYASPFYTFFAVPDPNNPGQTDKYPVLYESGDYACYDRYGNAMITALPYTGINKTNLEGGSFTFTTAGFSSVQTVFKQANPTANVQTFDETNHEVLNGVI